MELVDAIKNQGLANVLSKYKLKAVHHKTHPNLVLLMYSQIESPMGEKVVQQARGIILDSTDDWNIISYPYDKFFNYGEGHAAQINWETATVYEKLDGSAMSIYWYNNEWHVASSGSPDASGRVHSSKITFADLFWQVWEEKGYQLPTKTKTNRYCYVFELMTPFNRVITQHSTNKLVLHGGRHLNSLGEITPEPIAAVFGWDCVQTYSLSTWEEIVEAAKALDPMNAEGYVVCDANFNRVKVKSPQYVALTHCKESFTIRKLLEVIRTNESSEFLAYFPEWKDLHNTFNEKYRMLICDIAHDYLMVKDIENQKEFAQKALTRRCPTILFALRAGKISSVEEALKKMSINDLEKILLDEQNDKSFYNI